MILLAKPESLRSFKLKRNEMVNVYYRSIDEFIHLGKYDILINADLAIEKNETILLTQRIDNRILNQIILTVEDSKIRIINNNQRYG